MAKHLYCTLVRRIAIFISVASGLNLPVLFEASETDGGSVPFLSRGAAFLKRKSLSVEKGGGEIGKLTSGLRLMQASDAFVVHVVSSWKRMSIAVHAVAKQRIMVPNFMMSSVCMSYVMCFTATMEQRRTP